MLVAAVGVPRIELAPVIVGEVVLAQVRPRHHVPTVVGRQEDSVGLVVGRDDHAAEVDDVVLADVLLVEDCRPVPVASYCPGRKKACPLRPSRRHLEAKNLPRLDCRNDRPGCRAGPPASAVLAGHEAVSATAGAVGRRGACSARSRCDDANHRALCRAENSCHRKGRQRSSSSPCRGLLWGKLCMDSVLVLVHSQAIDSTDEINNLRTTQWATRFRWCFRRSARRVRLISIGCPEALRPFP